MNNPFEIEVLLKFDRSKYLRDKSGLDFPEPVRDKHGFFVGTSKKTKDGSIFTGKTKEGGTWTQRDYDIPWSKHNKGNGVTSVRTATGKDGTTWHIRGNKMPNDLGHGEFIANITRPDGSKEHIRQWQSGLSGSHHGIHTITDAKGKVRRFQLDQDRDWNLMNSWQDRVTSNEFHKLPAPSGARWTTPASRQAQVASAQAGGAATPPTTGGEVGGKEGHPFHGNQFTAHGTQVAVQGPQTPAKKSLTGKDFATDNLINW